MIIPFFTRSTHNYEVYVSQHPPGFTSYYARIYDMFKIKISLYVRNAMSSVVTCRDKSVGCWSVHERFAWFGGTWARPPVEATICTSNLMQTSSLATKMLPINEIQNGGLHPLTFYQKCVKSKLAMFICVPNLTQLSWLVTALWSKIPIQDRTSFADTRHHHHRHHNHHRHYHHYLY